MTAGEIGRSERLRRYRNKNQTWESSGKVSRDEPAPSEANLTCFWWSESSSAWTKTFNLTEGAQSSWSGKKAEETLRTRLHKIHCFLSKVHQNPKKYTNKCTKNPEMAEKGIKRQNQKCEICGNIISRGNKWITNNKLVR